MKERFYQWFRIKKVNTAKVKASQYNHFDHTYTKKPLTKRWNDFDGMKVQRDLYSAFLLMNMVDDKKLGKIDRERCIKEFDLFLENHKRTMSKWQKQSHTFKSMGLK
ncbi:hypothetical protein [Bacillus sp. FJAT-52991]|uniref:IDEAL domain-containing protein n=1 Tax=Bacillus kandeliae TaxID=3129297 RepID=A0ABZ2NB40_9BACI